MSIKTGFWINDIAVEFMGPIELRLSRGHEPWMAEVMVSDDRFDALDNPITLKFMGPDEDGNQLEMEWKKWYITQKVSKDEGSYSLIIADSRWPATYQRISVSYNIKWWGENDEYQQHTLNNGTPWKAYDAIKDAIEKFGLEFEDNPDLPQALKQIDLPDNISTHLGGGFFSASMSEVMPRLLETIKCDMRPTIEGKMIIVDRSSSEKYSDLLKNYRAVGGRAAPRDNSWSRPEYVVLAMPKRIEIGLLYDEPQLTTGTTSGGEVYELPELEVENVIPHVNFPSVGTADKPVPLANNPNLSEIPHEEFFSEVRKQVGFSRNKVLEVIMKPTIFPYEINPAGNAMTAERYFKETTMENWMKQTFRSRFRVKKIKLGSNDLTRKVADLKMARLAPDGTSKDEGNVFLDYIRINRFSTFPPGKGPASPGGSYLNAEFSDNIAFNEGVPAPFESRWITSDVDDLMFEVTGKRKRLLDVEYWPGKLKNSMRYGDVQDLVDGKPFAEVQSTLELDSKFKMRVIAHGLMIAPVNGEFHEYRKIIGDRKGLWKDLPSTSRFGPNLYIRIDDMTANYQYTGSLPGKLLNQTEIDERAEEVSKQVLQSYNDAKLGVVTYDGFETIVNGVQTGGDIYDTVLKIGFTQEFTIETSYIIMPEIRSISGNREEYGSVPVPAIG